MGDQLGLFDTPTAPFQKHSGTSKAAAEAIKPKVQSLEAAVLAYIRREGHVGATDPEIFAALKKKFPGVKEGTLRARRCELIGKGTGRYAATPLVVDSGGRRALRASDTPSTVWIAKEFAE